MSMDTIPQGQPATPCSCAYEVISQAREVADEILSDLLREPITKAINLRTQRGMTQAVAALSRSLRAKGQGFEAAAVREAVRALDVDWGRTDAAQRRKLIDGARMVVTGQVAGIPQVQSVVFGEAAQEVVAAARQGVRQDQKLNIGTDFNALDERIVKYLRGSEAHLVKDEYGRRSESFGREAGRIVSEGLEAGLGRQDITERLAAAARDNLINRNEFYWDVVAASFIARGRSFGQLSAYAEAGIERYIIEAVLDENTTEVCRFLHGKTFTVNSGLRTFDRVEAQPENLKKICPWIRDSVDAQGRRVMVASSGVGQPGQRIAIVDKPGFGEKDTRGNYSAALSSARLQDLGVSFPPFHGLCRSTTVADV